MAKTNKSEKKPGIFSRLTGSGKTEVKSSEVQEPTSQSTQSNSQQSHINAKSNSGGEGGSRSGLDEKYGQSIRPDPDAEPIGIHWPVQSLFYGSTLCVEWNGGGGEYSVEQDNFNIDDIDVAVGRTEVEALSAIISSEMYESNPANPARAQLEELLTAFGLGVYNQLQQPDGDLALDQAVHRQTFMSTPGGSFSDYRVTEKDGPLEEVEIAAPNFYESKDITILISNTHRSTRHSEDGVFDQNGLLRCRVSGKHYFQGLGLGTEPFESILNHGGIPSEIGDLNIEMNCWSQFITKPELSDDTKHVIISFAAGRHHGFSKIVNGEQKDDFPTWAVGWTWAFLVYFYRSPIAVNLWSQAWVPLFADYKVEIHPVSVSDWSLGDVEFEIENSVLANIRNGIGTSAPHEISNRALLFGKSGAIFSEQISRLVSELDDAAPEGFADLAEQMKALDILTAVIQDEDSLLHQGVDGLLASGVLDMVEIEIIDAFGQVVTLQKGSTSNPLNPNVALSLETDLDDRYCLLHPRMSVPSRLNLTLLDAFDDAERASGQTSPIAAFLLPDHIEWAMEVFDYNGDPCGQLRVAERDWLLGGYQAGRLMWDSAPGTESELGSPAEIGNPHVDGILGQLVRISLDDEIGLQEHRRDPSAEITDTPEGVLSAFMRAVDTSLRSVDPLGKNPEDLPSLFAGRPVAVVRAELELENYQEDVNQIESNQPVEVKLGAMERTIDGLLGYFLNDDYSKFHAVLPSDSATNRHDGNDLLHPYLNYDPTIDMRLGEKIRLTLIMDPQSAVHVTSGFLPQKEITLMREHKHDQLSKLAPTFKFGPMLVDPTTVRMPIPDLIQPVRWSWVSRPSTSEWTEGPIVMEDGKPHFPDGRATAWNGWIKLDLDESQEN